MAFNTGLGGLAAPLKIPNNTAQFQYPGINRAFTPQERAVNNVATAAPVNNSGPVVTNNPPVNNVVNNVSATPDANAIARANVQQQAMTARDTALGSARNSFGDLSRNYGSGIDGLLQKIRVGQQGVDQSRENNALNRLRSLNDLRDSVRQGIQSGSVRLSNGNALDSSAAEALAKGYGRFGTQQAGDIQNEFSLGNRDIDTTQSNLDYERQQGMRDLDSYKQTQASQIGNSVYDRLAAIQDSAMTQGVDGGLGDLNVQKQQIINEALAALQGLDQSLRDQSGGIRALDGNQVEANAYRLFTQGGGGDVANSFNYETAPGIAQATQNGAPIAQLPIRRRPDQF